MSDKQERHGAPRPFGGGSEWRERAVAVGACGPGREGLLVWFLRWMRLKWERGDSVGGGDTRLKVGE